MSKTRDRIEHECPHCGVIYSSIPHDCPEYPELLTETCPICEEPIESFLSHMRRCPER